MRITIELECDNDAFFPRPEREVARILRELTALRIGVLFPHNCAIDCQQEGSLSVSDINGNRVGSVTVTP